MNDPVASISAPPPRYLLESDSSDEEGQGYYAGAAGGPSSRPKIRQTTSAEISIEGIPATKLYDCVIVGTGQAGRYIAKKAGKGHEDPTIKVKSSNGLLGRGWELNDKEVLLALDDVENEDVWTISKALLEKINASSWVIVSTYLPSMYIVNDNKAGERISGEAPIRYISSAGRDINRGIEKTGAVKLNSPNFVTGLSAALASAIVHPVTSGVAEGFTILSLPLPLSQISSVYMTSTAGVVAPGLAQLLKSASTTSSSAWGEGDDEPYVNIGAGRKKESRGSGQKREEYSSMYM